MKLSEITISIPKFLYHATYDPLLNSIQKHGLGGRGAENKKWEDSKADTVYLAKSPEVAESYAETSDAVPEDWLDQIVVLKVRTDRLPKSNFSIDTNVLDNEGDTLEYSGVIDWNDIIAI